MQGNRVQWERNRNQNWNKAVASMGTNVIVLELTHEITIDNRRCVAVEVLPDEWVRFYLTEHGGDDYVYKFATVDEMLWLIDENLWRACGKFEEAK